MQKLRKKLTYANVVATLALIVAIAGGSTAVAVSVNAAKKKSDVNKKGNIRAGRVTAKKLADGNVTAAKLAGIDVVQATGADRASADCPTASGCSGAARRSTRSPGASASRIGARGEQLGGGQQHDLRPHGLRPLPEGIARP